MINNNEINIGKKLIELLDNKFNKTKEIINKNSEIYEYSFENVEYILNNEFNNIISILPKKKGKYITYKKDIINDYFNKYYDNFKNKITQKIIVKVLYNLFEYYSNLFHTIIKISKALYETIDLSLYNIKYKPMISLTSFSAIQEIGIWKKNKEIQENEKMKNYLKLNSWNSLYKFFVHSAYNFVNFFTSNNIYTLMNNNENNNLYDKNKIKIYVEDLIITYYTCLRIFDINHSNLNLISILNKLFIDKKEEFLFASIKYRLMDTMYLSTVKPEKKYSDELDKLLNELKKREYIELELEIMFGKFIINLKLDKDNMYKEIINRLNEIEKNENYEIENKKSFLKLFRFKVNYSFIKYKIKKGICDKNDLDILKNSLIIFEEEKEYYFFKIKTYLLISEWYIQKWKNQKNKNEDPSKYKELFKENIQLALNYNEKLEKYNYKDYFKEKIKKKQEKMNI